MGYTFANENITNRQNMNSIGFKNFRRFASFPEMDLGDITLLVGGNNSGKSTLVKALLLCLDNARLMTAGTGDNVFASMKPKFRFDANEWHDVKIKTFSRAIHNRPAPSLDLLDEELTLPIKMRFAFTLGNFKIIIEVAGDRDKKDEVTGDVTYISIEDRGNKIRYSVSYEGHTMSYAILGSATERETLLQKLYNDYDAAKQSLDRVSEAGDDIAAISAQSERVESLAKRIAEIENPIESEQPENLNNGLVPQPVFRRINTTQSTSQSTSTSWDFPIEEYTNIVNENLLLHVIGNFIGFANNPGKAQPSDIADPNEFGAAMQEWMYVQGARAALRQEVDKIKKSQSDLEVHLQLINIEYIKAHEANQNTIYNTADRNDYIAQTVHEFVRANIVEGQEYRFITYWMKEFDIGEDFEVLSIDGEAYRVKIKAEDGSTVNLADKGMGSIQVMILLLRLATILRIYHLRNRRNSKAHANLVDDTANDELFLPTVIIEEPEQNLHPRVQSKLADLLLYLNIEYRCKFIIETHSEYLIRKTQVLVANEKYEDERALKENNPFKVYYFDADNAKIPYYQMEYRTDGNFSNEFGTGFFDEANKLLYDIL